jgi:hypothetical protein
LFFVRKYHIISDKEAKIMNVNKTINGYMQRLPCNKLFTNVELLKFGHRANIDQILSRLVKAKKLTRVARGIFMKIKKASCATCIGKDLPELLPEPAKIAEAIVRTSKEIITVHGAEAARQLRLTTQVPAKPVFLTNGATRHIRVGNMEIVIKHVSSRKIPHADTIVGLVYRRYGI